MTGTRESGPVYNNITIILCSCSELQNMLDQECGYDKFSTRNIQLPW